MAASEAPLCYVGIARNSAAFRLMKQMGWQEGEGLGKENQGIKGYVRVANKQDTSGFGTEQRNKWAFDTTQFDNILKRLKVNVKDDGTGVDQKADSLEMNAANTPQNSAGKPARHQGRYKKRENAKCIQNYSTNDLEGILVRKGEHLPSNECKPKMTGNEEIDTSDSEVTIVDIDPRWWGLKCGFVSGGFLGSESRRNKSFVPTPARHNQERTAFCEEDQENLYKLVQNKSTCGKQGLGMKDGRRKVAGCYFEGRKTCLDQDGTEGPINAESLTSPRPRSRACTDVGEPVVKLKKLCKQILSQVPEESLKLKQLKARIDQHHSSVFSKFSSKADAIAFLRHKLEGSEKFAVEGKRVSLAVKG